ncbi:hypothetical protein [Wielerella bovis]|uniref:hypothetical protein n=1 Tax=Wielerella bovis TaxID=2917790 RepID=UPI002018E921|nr:hypothetical protein [Wielerella bovis]MCG7656424.1 hypothetical protein [Wielerella bovis]MCG7658649.1 hypothetical protein [Wielerella bovis]
MLKGFRDTWLCANNRLSRLPFNFYEISYPEFALFIMMQPENQFSGLLFAQIA